jgi:hypothetical protein
MVVRLVCLGYWIFLTVLLLTPNPVAVVGLEKAPIFPWGKFGIHLMFFAVLSVLVHATGWPKRPWWPLIVLLVVYALTTETMQLFVPHRSARGMDAIENLLGLAVGAGVYWVAQQWALRFDKRKQAVQLATPADADDTEGTRK